ncbi:MAG: DMP19 family protein [Opitutaceae bacterium]
MKLIIILIIISVLILGIFLKKNNTPRFDAPEDEYDWRADPKVWAYHKAEIAQIKQVLGSSISEIFAKETPQNTEDIFNALNTLCSWKSLNNHTLSETEEIILNIPGLGMEVHNGGFNQYFFNSAGDDWKVIYSAMEKSEDIKGLEKFSKILSIFPNSSPSENREERWKQLDALGEDEQYELFEPHDEQFWQNPFPNMNKIWAYVKTHQNDVQIDF